MFCNKVLWYIINLGYLELWVNNVPLVINGMQHGSPYVEGYVFKNGST